MLKKLRNFLISVGAVIMPSHCLICNKIIANGYFCAKDFSGLRFLTDPACAICFQPFEFEQGDGACCAACLAKKPKYERAIAVMRYDEISKKFIFSFKYFDRIDLSKFFAKLMLNQAKEMIMLADFIVPIPLHKKRLGQRKYNHSALIAKDLAKLTKIKLIYDLVTRKRNTKSQSSLSKIGRSQNIKGAFAFNEKYLSKVKGKNILLIDDVITTGATINECCKVLKKAGIRKIFVLTLAKTVI